MEIILSNLCESFTGSLNKKHGYSIRRVGKKFFGQRKTKGAVPPEGHWRFIVDCAEIAKCGLYFTDIRVPCKELESALLEARHFIAAQNLMLRVYGARDILNLKTLFGI